MTHEPDRLSAQLYDALVADWPGEIDFYRRLMAAEGVDRLLEVACGTGRVLLQLADAPVAAVGLDKDAALLDVARRKGAGRANVQWTLGDMVEFDLDATFQLALIPGHAFQHLLTPAAQLSCLTAIRRHLQPGGRLVVHLDHPEIDWLGDLTRDLGGVFGEPREVVHPETGVRWRLAKAWRYDPSTQTATAVTRRQEVGPGGTVLSAVDSAPVPLHCVFRFEMEHLLARAGYTVEQLAGSFTGEPFGPESREMIWVARAPQATSRSLHWV